MLVWRLDKKTALREKNSHLGAKCHADVSNGKEILQQHVRLVLRRLQWHENFAEAFSVLWTYLLRLGQHIWNFLRGLFLLN